MKRWNLKIFGLVFVLLFLSSCDNPFKKEKKQKEFTQKIKIVKILNLKDSDKNEKKTTYPAQIYPFKNVVLAFEVSGEIVDFNFNLGDKIKKNQIIASLDKEIYRANFNQAKANYDQAKLNFVRTKKLYSTKALSKSKFEQSENTLNVTRSALKIAKKNLENTDLKADFDGTLAKKFVDDYAKIVAKQQIAIFQDNSKYKIKFQIPERDILNAKIIPNVAQIAKRYKISVAFDTNYDKFYPAKFYDFTTIAEPVTRTYEATAVLEKPKDIIVLPGMTAKVFAKPVNPKYKNLFIPLDAVFSNHDKKSFVWIVDKKHRVHAKEIKIGKIFKSDIEILKGLTKDDEIVISGVHLLKENQEVKAYKKMGL